MAVGLDQPIDQSIDQSYDSSRYKMKQEMAVFWVLIIIVVFRVI